MLKSEEVPFSAESSITVESSESSSSPKSKMSFPANISLSSTALKEWIYKRKETIRPWSLFIRTNNFETPNSLSKISKRLYKNVEYFQSNYVFVFIVLFIYCIITSPLLLVVMAASGGTSYYLKSKNAQRKLFLGGKEISLAQQYAAVNICSIPLFLIAGAGSIVFWVIGASIFCIGLHASFYNNDAVEADDQESLTGTIVEEV